MYRSHSSITHQSPINIRQQCLACRTMRQRSVSRFTKDQVMQNYFQIRSLGQMMTLKGVKMACISLSDFVSPCFSLNYSYFRAMSILHICKFRLVVPSENISTNFTQQFPTYSTFQSTQFRFHKELLYLARRKVLPSV